MKSLISLLVLSLLVGCSSNVNEPIENKSNEVNKPVSQEQVFVPSSPISMFDEQTLVDLDALFSGSPKEIAQSIYDWQIEHMVYVAYGPVSDMMRWNFMLPGIYTTQDMLNRNINAEGKFEGLCYNFATLYCSIAIANGLDCQVTQMKEKPSELDPSIDPKTTTGLGPDEYARLEELLIEKGYSYDYELIRSIAKETSAHYRAEVMIDSKWEVYDASSYFVGDTYNQTYEFYPVDWNEGYQDDLVNS